MVLLPLLLGTWNYGCALPHLAFESSCI
jgi:hypothetical protein